jgi:Domain of unknown function (DUF4124)
MRKRLFTLFSALLLTGSALADAYRWTDEDGIVHYSDKPHEGAERVVLPTDTRAIHRQRTTQAPAQQGAAGQQAKAGAVKYESLNIVSPGAEETLWNIEGVLNVTLDIRPGLQEGHQVRVYFDGNPRMVDAASFQIEEVYRGVHNIQAEVVDASGKLMIRSVTNRFYVQQNTIIQAR